MEYLDFPVIFALTIKIYLLLTPPITLSAFTTYTGDKNDKERFYIATKCSLAIFITGVLLFLFGANIFELFGFTLDAFRIGVGLLLFIAAINLMNGEKKVPEHTHEDFSIVPLAIPLSMGPSTIGVVMVLGASSIGFKSILTGIICIFCASFLMAVTLWLAHPIERLIRKTGIQIMAKITALFLTAIAAQVIFTGIKAFLKQIN